jgi:hypothetical protein
MVAPFAHDAMAAPGDRRCSIAAAPPPMRMEAFDAGDEDPSSTCPARRRVRGAPSMVVVAMCGELHPWPSSPSLPCSSAGPAGPVSSVAAREQGRRAARGGAGGQHKELDTFVAGSSGRARIVAHVFDCLRRRRAASDPARRTSRGTKSSRPRAPLAASARRRRWSKGAAGGGIVGVAEETG